MTKRERVLAVMEGKQADCIPSSFSLHFPKGAQYGDVALKAHVEFFQKTDVDILKVMNENLIPSVNGIIYPSDWKKIPSYSRTDTFIVRQTDLVKRILDTFGEEALLICTIHGICASMVHPMRPQYQDLYDIRAIQLEHFRSHPTVYLDASKRIAEAQVYMVEEVIKAGADGIYFAALGGEGHLYTEEEFNTAIKPFDLQIMQAVRDLNKHVILHLCKKGLNLNYFKEYGPLCDIINWGIYENGIPYEEGMAFFPWKDIHRGTL